MLQLAVPRLRFLSIVSHFHTVMDTLLKKSKTRCPLIAHWGCKLNESYYDPRIRVFVILLSLSVKCLDPSFAVDGTKYLLNLLELQKVIIPTYCVQEQYPQKNGVEILTKSAPCLIVPKATVRISTFMPAEILEGKSFECIVMFRWARFRSSKKCILISDS